MPQEVFNDLNDHLFQHVRRNRWQEDLCFGLWYPSQGLNRYTGLLADVLLPEKGERTLSGNVSYTAAYFERCLDFAAKTRAGLAFLHSHVGPGWQGMSHDDIIAERDRLAGAALGMTSLPLLGLTLGTDGAVSARFWHRTGRKSYDCRWCVSVRVVGKALTVTYHPRLCPAPPVRDELHRTVSVWGESAQADLSRLHVGIVGLGSVGRMVAEGIGRMGTERVTFLDYDRIEPHNLDRLLGASQLDALLRRPKVLVAKRDYLKTAVAASPVVRAVQHSVVEPDGYRACLDCDVIFSCVDRPWPRHVLNQIAYAHLVPVIDGGVLVRMRDGKFRGVEWSARTAGPERRCLACAKAYNPSLVETERAGLLDDPHYIEGLPTDSSLRRNENVFAFSLGVASQELVQLIALSTQLLSLPDLGDQRYHYNLRQSLVEDGVCRDGCEFQRMVATGESLYPRDSFLGSDLRMAAELRRGRVGCWEAMLARLQVSSRWLRRQLRLVRTGEK